MIIERKKKGEVGKMKITKEDVMKTTEKEIKIFLLSVRGHKPKSIEFGKNNISYHYTYDNKDLNGLTENVIEWLDKIVTVDGQKYIIDQWWLDQNSHKIDIDNCKNIKSKKETEKALLLDVVPQNDMYSIAKSLLSTDFGTDVWIPKSVMHKIKEV